ncbi:FAM86, N-terminal, partial [Dillenia turbinata]
MELMEEDEEYSAPPFLHLVSAFLAMEPSDCLLSFSRECGGGSITERVQRFLWDDCIIKHADKSSENYLKIFLKKLIAEVESNHFDVLEELYEKYTYYMTSLKDDNLAKGSSKVSKCISFLFSDDCSEIASCPNSMKLVVPLQCSLNMLEGDTGCAIWPSSLFLSEFILSSPTIFSNRSCFEVGSGVGLVGVCLSHVKASEVTLSDGDISTLANMRVNLELNHLSVNTDMSDKSIREPNSVNCIHLPWESASESGLKDIKPDIIVAADVIYNPSCLSDLVRVLGILLKQTNSGSCQPGGACDGSELGNGHLNSKDGNDAAVDLNGGTASSDNVTSNPCPLAGDGTLQPDKYQASKGGPVAYIASVIRNIETFNYFLALADQANLRVADITQKVKLLNMLPYMKSYDRSS